VNEDIAQQFEVNWCGRIYAVTVDRKLLGALCAKASRNKSRRSKVGPLRVKDLNKENPNP
jgi:hypothetical protein